MTNRLWVCVAVLTLLTGLLPATKTQAQLLSDPMELGTNWTVAQEPIGPDSSATFGFDYSALSIPEAPNSDVGGGDSATTGLKLEVNNGDGFAIEEELYIFSNQSFTGQYTVKADVWVNYALAGSGTTEFAGIAVGGDGVFDTASTNENNSLDRSRGAALLYTGEGGSSRDYRLYKGGDDGGNFVVGEQFVESAQYSGANGDLANETDPTRGNNNAHPTLSDAFPAIDLSAFAAQSQTGSGPAGAGGMQWMTMTVEVDPLGVASTVNPAQPGFARFKLQSAASGEMLQIGTVINSNGSTTNVPYEGNIALVMADIFNSVSDTPNLQFALFDNVLVTEGIPVDVIENADFNGDLTVDAIDYAVWRENLGLGDGTPGSLDVSDGDSNDDGLVDTTDYTIWRGQFGDVLTAPVATAVVPEPSSLVAALICGIGFMLRRLRQTSAYDQIG